MEHKSNPNDDGHVCFILISLMGSFGIPADTAADMFGAGVQIVHF